MLPYNLPSVRICHVKTRVSSAGSSHIIPPCDDHVKRRDATAELPLPFPKHLFVPTSPLSLLYKRNKSRRKKQLFLINWGYPMVHFLPLRSSLLPMFLLQPSSPSSTSLSFSPPILSAFIHLQSEVYRGEFIPSDVFQSVTFRLLQVIILISFIVK